MDHFQSLILRRAQEYEKTKIRGRVLEQIGRIILKENDEVGLITGGAHWGRFRYILLGLLYLFCLALNAPMTYAPLEIILFGGVFRMVTSMYGSQLNFFRRTAFDGGVFGCLAMSASVVYRHRLRNTYIPVTPPTDWKNAEVTIKVPALLPLKSSEEIKPVYDVFFGLSKQTYFSILVSNQLRSNQRICVSNPFEFTFNQVLCSGENCMDYVRSCMNDANKEFTIVPINNRGHRVVVVLNHVQKTLELHDSNGFTLPHDNHYAEMVKSIRSLSDKENYKFIGQKSFGFQVLDHIDEQYSGMCLAWSWWYIETRFLNPDTDSDVLDNAIADLIHERPFMIYEYVKQKLAEVSANEALLNRMMIMTLNEGDSMRRPLATFRETSNYLVLSNEFQEKSAKIFDRLAEGANNDIRDFVEKMRERLVLSQRFAPNEDFGAIFF